MKQIHWRCSLCLLLVLNKASCNLVTASFTWSSSTAKVKLILDAPCEISVTLISLIVLNTRAAIPGVPLKPSPTTQMIARPFSTRTVPNCSSSSTIAGNELASSNESETLTSEVVTTSITVRCRSKTSKSARRNPYAPSMRAEVIWTVVTPVLCAMAFTVREDVSVCGPTSVPGSPGDRELQIRTGIERSIAG